MKKLESVFQIFFLCLFSYITILVTIIMFDFSFIAGLVAMLLLAGMILVCKKETGSAVKDLFTKRISAKSIPANFIWLFMQLASTVVMLVMSFRLRVNLSWDWGVVMRTAAYYVDSGIIGDPDYYAQYPNNQVWLMCLIALFKLVRFINSEAQMQQFQTVSIVLMCVLAQLTILLIYKTAKLIWNEKKALFCGGAAMLCLPIYLYAQFAYTDIPGMLLCAICVYLYFKLTKSDCQKQYIYLFFLGITGAAAYKIKIMGVIVLIAIVITMFIKMQSLKSFMRNIMLISCAFVITVGMLQMITTSVLPVSNEMYEQNRFPATHWVMMGLGKSGSYKQEDVDYTEAFPTYQEKQAATIQEIKNRIKDKGVSGLLKHTFYTKMKRTWCVSSLNGDDYTGREMLYDTIFQKVFTKKGSLHEGCLYYTWIYHFLLITGICISGLAAFVNKKSQLLVGRIAIFGVILFMSVWECNSRYLVCFLPVLFLTAFDGYVCCTSLNEAAYI